MSKRWLGMVFLAGWLGVSASARAQYPAPPASGDVPPHAFDDAPPHGMAGPGAAPAQGAPPFCPPLPPVPPPVDGPYPPPEAVPDNGFSNVHPDQATRSPRFYLGVDYLLLWVRKDQVPPLATTGSLNDLVPAAIGQPSTKFLMGPGGIGEPSSSGARVTTMYWFDQDHTFGVDANGIWLSDASRSAVVGGNGDPSGVVIARPFFNINAGTEDADPINVPGAQAGRLAVELTRTLYGGDANLRCSQCIDCGPFTRVTFLAGGRVMYLNENLLFTDSIHELPDTTGAPGNDYFLHDNFKTYNTFYGGQLGLESEARVGPIVFTLTGKAAVGMTHEVVRTAGDTTVTEPDGTVTYDPTRGLLVQPSNLGRVSRDRLAVLPEAIATLAWEFNEHLRISVGYNFLWWSSVARPGESIDRTVNVGAVGDVGQLGTALRPALDVHSTGIWMQGVSAGLLFSY